MLDTADCAVIRSFEKSHLIRPRLVSLFEESIQRPLVTVCAGAGYGKTRAVVDFIQAHSSEAVWMQISQRDNLNTRFWESVVRAAAQRNTAMVNQLYDLGFPDSDDKLIPLRTLLSGITERRIIVLDDFHLIENDNILDLVSKLLRNLPARWSIILISRTEIKINLTRLIADDRAFCISEDDLCFTDSEISQYLRQQDIPCSPESIRNISEDTKGWALAVNLIARALKKAPECGAYVCGAAKFNIFKLIEAEIFNTVSERLRHFLIKLSLIDHLAADLVHILAGDEDLVAEMERQSAYIRYDSYTHAYLIHHLFLDFLRRKQNALTEEEKRITYRISGDWCDANGLKIDAISYYDKIGAYVEMVKIIFEMPTQVPEDAARFALEIFDRMPEDVLRTVELSAVTHIRLAMCVTGMLPSAYALAIKYEAIYLQMPDDALTNHMLGGIYYCLGIIRRLMCTRDDIYDSAGYHAKQDACLTRFPYPVGQLANHPCGPWVSLVGISRKGAPEEYIDELTSAVRHVAHCFNGSMSGDDDIAVAELAFYRGDIPDARRYLAQGLKKAREHSQYELAHRALFYIMRIAFLQGDLSRAEWALTAIGELTQMKDYGVRFITNDIAHGWFQCALRNPECVPEWLRGDFAKYGHAYFLENFGNQIKVRYCLLTRNYPPLLAYISEMRERESILFGRIGLLAVEAIIHYKARRREKALMSLGEAYTTAAPNDIVLPFIELGKDMRTLVSAALRENNCDIPRPWLESINRQAAVYAKRQTHMIAEYRYAHSIDRPVGLSSREREVFLDLSHGLSRSEIAESRKLSPNTVKLVTSSLYEKLGAVNLADAVRIVLEKGLL